MQALRWCTRRVRWTPLRHGPREPSRPLDQSGSTYNVGLSGWELLQHARRYTTHQRVRWDVLRDERACCDSASPADRNARKDGHTRADPDTVLDRYGLGEPLSTAGWRVADTVVVGDN